MEPTPHDEPLPENEDSPPMEPSAMNDPLTDLLRNKQLQRLVKFPTPDEGQPCYINPINVAGLAGVDMGLGPAVDCCAVLLVRGGALVVGVSIERAAKALAWRIDELPPPAEHKGPNVSLN